MSTSAAVSERERAKQIIAEIIHQAGGLSSKTELLRVFWRAHLVYSGSQPGYLSFWPVLKTATGPAIQEVDLLLGELVAEGVLRIDETSADGMKALRLEATDRRAAGEALPDGAVEAIQQAVATGDEMPDPADYKSLGSWNEAADGEELNIYLDAIPDAEYADRKRRLQEMAAVLKDAWR